jgi:hypothetical protein
LTFKGINADAASYKDRENCVAWVNTGGCIWTPDSPDPEACFECEALAVSVGQIKEIDALVEASTESPLCILWSVCFLIGPAYYLRSSSSISNLLFN